MTPRPSSNEPSRFDALVTDRTLPGTTDGAAVARATRALRPEAPIVLMSGDVEASAPPFAGLRVIAKPFFAADLLKLLTPPATRDPFG